VTFPAVLVEHGTPPPANPNTLPCRDCGARYEHHSGHLCLICRAPVEHHDPARIAFEIAACARLSQARQAGGHPLRPHEQWCVNQHRNNADQATKEQHQP